MLHPNFDDFYPTETYVCWTFVPEHCVLYDTHDMIMPKTQIYIMHMHAVLLSASLKIQCCILHINIHSVSYIPSYPCMPSMPWPLGEPLHCTRTSRALRATFRLDSLMKNPHTDPFQTSSKLGHPSYPRP